MRLIPTSTALNRACGATMMTLMLASCGGGGNGDAVVQPPAPPAPAPAPQSITLSGDASQVLAGGKAVTLTATPAVAATIAWSIAEGPGTLSAPSGASVTYTPPAAGINGNTPVVIKASAGDAVKTYRVTVYPDPGTPGLSLITGTLGSIGNLDGAGTAARFTRIADMATDDSGNLFVIDAGKLRKVSAAGQVSTIALGSNQLYPVGVSVAPDNSIYLLLNNNQQTKLVMKLLPDNSLAPFLTPEQTDQSTRRIVAGPNQLYMIGGSQVSAIGADGSPGVVIGKQQDTAPCRDGAGANARLSDILDAALDAAGNLILQDCGSVRKVTPAGVVTTLAGDLTTEGVAKDGVGAAAHFSAQASLAVDKSGNIRVLDTDYPVYRDDESNSDLGRMSSTAYRLRKVTSGGAVTTLFSGTFQASSAIESSTGVAHAPQQVRYLRDGTLIVAKQAEVRKLADDGALSGFAGDEGDIVQEVDGTVATARFIMPRSITADLAGNLYVIDDVTDLRTTAYKIAPSGQVTRILNTKTMNQPDLPNAGVIRDPKQILAAADGTLYASWGARLLPLDRHPICGAQIYKLATTSEPQLLAGISGAKLPSTPRIDGAATAADFCAPVMLGFDVDGNLYAEDMSNNALVYRKITPQGVVSTLSAAPAGVGVAADGYRYRADQGQIYRSDASGNRIVVAGGTDGAIGNRIGALPGNLIPYNPLVVGSRVSLAVTPTGPGSLAVISGGAILKLVLPH